MSVYSLMITIVMMMMVGPLVVMATEELTFIPLPVSQPVPCACLNTTTGVFLDENVNCTSKYSATNLNAMRAGGCPYPWPAELEDANYPPVCVDGVWTTDRDLVIPAKVLADFCNSRILVDGNVFVPSSSNISIFQPLNGTLDTSGLKGGGIKTKNGVLSNSGWLLIVLANASGYELELYNETSHDEKKPNIVNPPPTDGTLYANLYQLEQVEPVPFSFETLNRTQFWQNGYFAVPCQTITPTFLIEQNEVVPLLNSSYSIQISILDQCQHDWVIFVGVVAGVGGAIILATIVYAIVLIAKSIHESINAPVTKIQYQAMDRGDDDIE